MTREEALKVMCDYSECIRTGLKDCKSCEIFRLKCDICGRLYNEATDVLAESKILHSYWTKRGTCHNCGVSIPIDSGRDFISKSECKYCYYCGAKMDATPTEE